MSFTIFSSSSSTFSPDGRLLEAIDKTTGESILKPGESGNVFSLYVDNPICWDAWDVEENDISLCREMNARLITLRSEHQAWAYETGLVETSLGSVAEGFKQGSSLSAWWTSILYERHPKVSPCLYELYLLRTAELLLLEGGCTSLEVHGLNPVAVSMLESLCKARGWGFVAGEKASEAHKAFPLKRQKRHHSHLFPQH